MSRISCTAHAGPCYWLADDTYPTPKLVDGCHSAPSGVAEAAKLHHRIFGADGPWVMVKIEPVPEWGAAPINEESAQACARLLQAHASTQDQGPQDQPREDT